MNFAGVGMRVFWNDFGEGLISDQAKEADIHEVNLIWSDQVRGAEGNFMGLIDDQDRTIQFYFECDIPDGVDDASDHRIVLMDFPQPEQNGSYVRQVANGEVDGLIKTAFELGSDYRCFGDLTFVNW